MPKTSMMQCSNVPTFQCGAGQPVRPCRLRPPSRPISHPQKVCSKCCILTVMAGIAKSTTTPAHMTTSLYSKSKDQQKTSQSQQKTTWQMAQPSVFQPFCCSGTLHKCQNHSRNPMACNDQWVKWHRQSGIFRVSGDGSPQWSWEAENLWESRAKPWNADDKAAGKKIV